MSPAPSSDARYHGPAGGCRHNPTSSFLFLAAPLRFFLDRNGATSSALWGAAIGLMLSLLALVLTGRTLDAFIRGEMILAMGCIFGVLSSPAATVTRGIRSSLARQADQRSS